MLWVLAIAPVAGAGLLAALGRKPRPWYAAVAGGTALLTLVLSVWAASGGWTGAFAWSPQLRLVAELTPLSGAVAILVPVIAGPILLYAAAHEDREGLRRLMVLLLIFAGGMELLVIARDFLTLLIGWEIVGACSWALISHHWRAGENPRSGAYAFVATRLGDLGLLVAAMAVYAGSGSFAYSALPSLPDAHLQLAAFGILVSAAAKSGQVPFAPWLFRAMAGPTSVSALLHAATMVAAGAYLLARLHGALDAVPGFAWATVAVGLTTAFAGGVVALLQGHAKKLLAASTSAHYGLMFVAVGAGYPGVAILHLVAHAGFKALLFLAAGVAGERAHSFELRKMGLGRALPLAAGLSAVGALALAGVPPLGGGWTKETVISAAGQMSPTLAIGVILAGGMSAAYAARFQLLANGPTNAAGGARPTALEIVAAAILATLTLLLSVLWLPAAHDALSALLKIDLPTAKIWEVVLSLALVAIGLGTGWFLAHRKPELGTGGRAAGAADWLGLPAAIRTLVTRPFSRGARWLGRFDADAIAGGAAALAKLVLGSSSASARLDRRFIQRGVSLAAAFAFWAAHVGDRVGERLSDGLAEGTAGLVGRGGRNSQRVQTGMAHHYYALMGIGAVAVIALLLAGN